MIKDVVKGKPDKTLSANLFNSTILPVMLYASEMWAATKKEEQTQRATERSMLGILLCEYIQTEVIWEWSEG